MLLKHEATGTSGRRLRHLSPERLMPSESIKPGLKGSELPTISIPKDLCLGRVYWSSGGAGVSQSALEWGYWPQKIWKAGPGSVLG